MREYPRSWQEFQDILHWVFSKLFFCLKGVMARKCSCRLGSAEIHTETPLNFTLPGPANFGAISR